jgi:hypothetical protein
MPIRRAGQDKSTNWELSLPINPLRPKIATKDLKKLDF